jgi:predicted permease
MTMWRVLWKSPTFALLAIVTLGLGIGLNAAIFSVADAVLFRLLPYRNPDRLVVALFGGDNPASPADYYDWKTQSTAFQDMSAAEYWTPNLTGDSRPEQLWAVRVTANLFDLLGTPPLLGRTFTAGDDTADGAPFAVISHRLWLRRFGGDPAIINRSLTLDGRGYQVLGVMPEGFEFPLFWATRAEIWTPLPIAARRTSTARSLRVFARLNDDVTLQQAQTELDEINRRIAAVRPDIRSEPPLQVIPLHEKIIGNVRATLLFLLVIVGLVLVLACANVANLLLVRATARRRELALRTALGATRLRLLRQLLAENLLISLLGGGLGLALAYGALRLFAAALPADLLPRQAGIAMNSTVLLFAAAMCAAATLLFGMLPALHASRADINDALKQSARATGGRETQWRRRAIASLQICIAVVLLAGAGLLLRSLVKLQSLEPGFAASNILTMTISVTGTNQSPAARRAFFYDDLLQAVAAVPGVSSTSLINHLPLAGDIWSRAFTREGQTVARPEEQPVAAYRVVAPGYFRTMQIQLRGRDFSNVDAQSAPAVVIINEILAQRYFQQQDPVGKHIKFGGATADSPWMTIVGVVPPVKQSSWTDTVGSEVYVPLLQSPAYFQNPAPHYSYMTLVAATTANPADLAGAIRNRITALEPNAPVSQVATMEEVIAQKLARPMLASVLSVTFAAIGLILAAVGVYGVISYNVSLRTQEFGVRTALGAKPADVLRIVLREGFSLAAAGVMLGLAVSWPMGMAMRSLLFGLRPDDITTYAVVLALIFLVTLAACYLPARRALRVDPIIALRDE